MKVGSQNYQLHRVTELFMQSYNSTMNLLLEILSQMYLMYNPSELRQDNFEVCCLFLVPLIGLKKIFSLK